MNKNDLIESIATSTQLSKADAGRFLDSFVDTLTSSLKKGEEVRLVGFGTFLITTSKARLGRNPRTGEQIQIPASRQPKFRAGKALKDAVN